MPRKVNVLSGAVLALSSLGCGSVAAQATSQAAGVPVPIATINAIGEGQREATPDRATIMLGVETHARTPAAAGAANADRMTTIRAALRQAGVGEREISTARYSVQVQVGPTQRDTSYVASNSVTVETRKLDEVGRLIDVGLGAGATSIGSLRYDLTDRTAMSRQALADAVADARRQAEVMAEAAGGRLGELLELGTNPAQYMPIYAAEVSYRMAASAAPTPVSPGSVTVSATVTGRWRFVPGR